MPTVRAPRQPKRPRRPAFVARAVKVPASFEVDLTEIRLQAARGIVEAWNAEAASSLGTLQFVIRADALSAHPREQAHASRDWRDFAQRVIVRFNREQASPLFSKLKTFASRLFAVQEPKFKTVLSIPAAQSVPGGQGTLDAWARYNTNLITSVSAGRVEQVGKILDANPNLHVRDLTAKLLDAAEGDPVRARLWARDQTLKLNGQIADTTAQAAGAARYRWHATSDGRTRDDHALLDGHVFRFDMPPVTNASEVEKGKAARRNNPHGDYQCRCEAEALWNDEQPDYYETFDGLTFTKFPIPKRAPAG